MTKLEAMTIPSISSILVLEPTNHCPGIGMYVDEANEAVEISRTQKSSHASSIDTEIRTSPLGDAVVSIIDKFFEDAWLFYVKPSLKRRSCPEVATFVQGYTLGHLNYDGTPVKTINPIASLMKRLVLNFIRKPTSLLLFLALIPVASSVTVRISRAPDIEDVHDLENNGSQASSWNLRDEAIYVVNKSNTSIPLHLDIVLRWHQSAIPIVGCKGPDDPSPTINWNYTDALSHSLHNFSSTPLPAPTVTPICITTPSPSAVPSSTKTSLDPVSIAGIIIAALVIGGIILGYCFLPSLMAWYRNRREQRLVVRYELRNGRNIAGDYRTADLTVS